MDKNKRKRPDKEEERKDPQEMPSEENQESTDNQAMVALTFDEYDALQKEVEALREEIARQDEGWLRTRADFDNYKKRVQRDAARTYQDTLTSVLKMFLNVADDLELALKHAPDEKTKENWVDGLVLIHQKLLNQMKNQGVERMDVNPGDEFDPNIHEAVTQEDNPDFQEGQIIDVIQPGYRLSDRIIRPAMVRVAR